MTTEQASSQPGPRGDPGSGLLNVEQLAAAIGVTRRAVGHWLKRGMQYQGITPTGGYLYDERYVREWLAKTTTEWGNQRRGSARKPAKPVDAAIVQDGKARLGPAELPTDVTAEQIRELLADPTGQAMDLAQSRAVAEQMKAVKLAAEASKLRGDVVPRAEAEDAWTRMLVAFDRRLSAIPGRLTPQLVHEAATAFDPEGPNAAKGLAEAARRYGARVIEILRSAVEDAKRSLAASPLRERPNGEATNDDASGRERFDAGNAEHSGDDPGRPE